MPDFNVGHALALWSATTMIRGIASYVADNQVERDTNDVERFISEAGANGKLWREVQSRFRRIRTRDLREIMERLEGQGSIRVEATSGTHGGHPIKRYLAV
jgi:hypothetical protein